MFYVELIPIDISDLNLSLNLKKSKIVVRKIKIYSKFKV